MNDFAMKFDDNGIFKLRDAVTVLGISEADEVILVKQYRRGVGGITIEFPGGIIDPGESASEAGIREFFEETGYAITEPKHLVTLEMEGVVSTHKISLIYGKVINQPVAQPESGIHIIKVPLKDMEAMISEGLIQHAPTVCLYYMLKNMFI